MLAPNGNKSNLTERKYSIVKNSINNLRHEIWVDVLGFEGMYQVSNFGRVKSLKRYTNNQFCKEDRMIVPRKDRYGYLRVDLKKGKQLKTFVTHILVADSFVSNNENKPYVKHKDGIKTNNHYSNLEWSLIDKENRLIYWDDYKNNVFNGLMLGDAGIPKDQNTFVVTQKSDRKEYLFYLCDVLGLEKERVFDKPDKVDSRTGKIYKGSYIRTLSDWYFKTQRERWYKKGKKIIPRDITISREMLLHFFLCDGSAFKPKGYNYRVIKFATNCFTDEEINWMIQSLKKINILSYKNGKLIYIKPESHVDFYNYIGECPVSCFKYKWI